MRIDDMTYGCKLITKDNNRLKSLNSKCAVTVAINLSSSASDR